MTRSEQERLAVLETHVSIILETQKKQSDDIETIRDAVTSVTGGWKIIAAIAGLAAMIGAILTSWGLRG